MRPNKPMKLTAAFAGRSLSAIRWTAQTIMASSIERLFTGMATEGDIDAMVTSARDEDLYLEFKQKADRRHGDLDEPDRRGFSKALSGFANADGGVIVWGVETARTQDGVDRAASLKPITGHAKFRSRLMDLLLNTTQPVVDGVEIEVINCQVDPNNGYVKCLVPPSDRPPHRAIHCEHQYWRRVTTGHRRMEHYELEDVFGRRLRPVLQLFAELRPRPGDDPHEELHFFLLNEGRGVAQHVGFLCRVAAPRIEGISGSGLQNATALNKGTSTVTYYDAQGVIHANGIYSSAGHAILKRETKGAPLELDAIVYAENMQTHQRRGTVTPEGLHKLT